MFETISHNAQILAYIVRNEFDAPGITFFTPNEFSQQLAYMNHPAGKIIKPHIHNAVERSVQYTLEVLFIKKGKMRVDFYDNNRNYLESRVIKGGDTILLATGGHGFEVIEDLVMLEVKQGPYAGELDKIRFEPHSLTAGESGAR